MIWEYNKEQERRTKERQKIKYEPQKDPAQSKKTDLNEFSLTLYIDALGLPENEDFFKFAHILKGESGDGWLQRFERFTKYLSQIKPSLKQKDRRYLLKLKKGIENSLNASYVLNELKGDKDYKEGVNRMSKQINSYLSTCENLAA